jgi:hypothetical protein
MTTLSLSPQNKNSFFWILILILAIILITSSCNVSKKLDKSSTKETKVNDLVTAFSQTITEKADTNITVPGVDASGEILLSDLLGGDSIVKNTPELIFTTKRVKNKVQTNVKRKSIILPITVSKQTITTGTQTAANSTVTETKVNTKDVDKGLPCWIWWLVLVIAALVVLYRYYRSRLPF